MKPTVFPEVLPNGGGYQIGTADGPYGNTDKINRIITIPVHQTTLEHFIRMHELAHVKWTPEVTRQAIARQYKVSPDALDVAEDARINIGLLRHGVFSPDLDVFVTSQGLDRLRDYIKFWADPGIPLRARARMAALSITSHSPFYRAVSTLRIQALKAFKQTDIPEEELDLLCYLFELIPNTVATLLYPDSAVSLRTTDEASRSLRDLATGIRRNMSELIWVGTRLKMPEFSGSIEIARWLDSLFPLTNRPNLDSPELEKLRQLLRQDRKLPPLSGLPVPTGLVPTTSVPWGQLFLEVAPMTRNARTARILSTKVPSDMGTRMRDISRIFTDSKLFERRKKIAGGSVLVDASGSMSLSVDDIEAIIEQAPAAMVATYSGAVGPMTTQCGTRLPGQSGVIRILAQRGYICRNPAYYRSPAKGANMVDGPALEWLARQMEPRLWISDGAVTGIDDRGSIDLVKQASRLCSLHAICRISNGEEVVQAFRNLKRGIPVHHERLYYDG